MTDTKDAPACPPGAPDPDTPVIDAASIFKGKREIWIEHAGVRYRLRITRKNRLILQK